MNIMKICIILISLFSIFTHPMHHGMMNSLKNKPKKDQFKIWHMVFQKPYDLNTPLAISKYNNFKETIKYIESRNAEQNEVVLGLGPFADMTFEEYQKEVVRPMTENDKPSDVTFDKSSFKSMGKKQINNHLDKTTTKAIYTGTEFFDKYADAEDEQVSKDDNLSFFDKYADSDEVPNKGRNLKQDDLTASTDYSTLFDSVFDQAKCNASTLFAVADMLEATYKLKYNKSIKIARQQLVECSQDGGGCQGPLFADRILSYIHTWGVGKEDDYPFTSSQGKVNKCKLDCLTYKPVIELDGFFDYCFATSDRKVCDENMIKNYLKKGPYVSILDINHQDFKNYQSGILNYFCFGINHTTLVVQGSTNFLKIRLSFGSKFGENGYARVKRKVGRDADISCGLEAYAYQANAIDWTEN